MLCFAVEGPRWRRRVRVGRIKGAQGTALLVNNCLHSYLLDDPHQSRLMRKVQHVLV